MTKFNPVTYTFSLKLALPDALIELMNETLSPVGFYFEQLRTPRETKSIHMANSVLMNISLVDSQCFLMDFNTLTFRINECFQVVHLTDSQRALSIMWKATTELIKEIDNNHKVLTLHRVKSGKEFLSYPLTYDQLTSIKAGTEIDFYKAKTNKADDTKSGTVLATIERGQCIADVLESSDLRTNCKNIRNIHTLQDRTKFVVGTCSDNGRTYTVNIVAPESIIAIR